MFVTQIIMIKIIQMSAFPFTVLLLATLIMFVNLPGGYGATCKISCLGQALNQGNTSSSNKTGVTNESFVIPTVSSVPVGLTSDGSVSHNSSNQAGNTSTAPQITNTSTAPQITNASYYGSLTTGSNNTLNATTNLSLAAHSDSNNNNDGNSNGGHDNHKHDSNPTHHSDSNSNGGNDNHDSKSNDNSKHDQGNGNDHHHKDKQKHNDNNNSGGDSSSGGERWTG